MIGERIPRRSNGECQLFGADGVASVRPHLPARVRGRQRINRHVQDARDLRRTLLAFDPECDRNLLHPEILADQRRERRHGSAGSAGKDRPQCLSLFVVSALIDIGGHRPISICHRSRRLDCQRHVKAIKHDAAISTAFNVEDQRHVAHTLGWSGSQRGGLRYEAWTYNGATAVLEIVTGKLPLNLVCHRSLLLSKSRTGCSRPSCAWKIAYTVQGWAGSQFRSRSRTQRKLTCHYSYDAASR